MKHPSQQLSLFPDEESQPQQPSREEIVAQLLREVPLEERFEDLFSRLGKSTFRSRFHLSAADLKYLCDKGFTTIEHHAEDFVRKRLSHRLENDGEQTPMRGHPVFRAQHATGCCCRGCFEKWHHIPASRDLTDEEQRYAVEVIMEWIYREIRHLRK